MTAPIPDPYVKAIFDDGPHAGETLQVPWARLEVPMTRWEGEQLIESLYELVPPWRGQAIAHYRLVVEPEEKAA